jgi:hypothetical protein
MNSTLFRFFKTDFGITFSVNSEGMFVRGRSFQDQRNTANGFKALIMVASYLFHFIFKSKERYR